MITKNKLYLLLGSNINPEENLKKAFHLLKKEVSEILGCSSVWASRSIGFDGPDFLNAVVAIETNDSITDFKQNVITKIELDLNRIRTENKNSPRTIDIDILMINTEIVDQEIWKFAHIAAPLSELLPDLVNPENQKQLKSLSAELVNQNIISKRSDIKLNI
jgi:2-amino-4-hydroxy-6-hydroxymethyldihydropteridine diphosphokinase